MHSHSGRNRRTGCLVLMGALVCAAYAPDLAAQTGEQFELTFKPFQAELNAKDEKLTAAFYDGLAFLHQEDDKQRALKGDMTIGFSSDETGYKPDSLFKLLVGANLSRGVYPAELIFTADVNVQVGGSDFKEDVAHFVASYQWHHTEWVEYYAFVERFSDSYMGIQQRYETGLGAMFGVHLGKRKDWSDIQTKFEQLKAASCPVKEQLKMIKKSNPSGKFPSETDYEALSKKAAELKEALGVKASPVFLGMAVSAFSELEQVKIDALIAPPASAAPGTAPTKKPFSLGAEQRFRYTLRPTVILRPTPDVTISAYPYVKMPLESPYKVNGRLDYRLDLLTAVTWNLAQAATGNEQVGFTFKFDRHIDNVPPGLLQSQIDAEPTGTVFVRTVAPRRHDVVSLSLKVSWGG